MATLTARAAVNAIVPPHLRLHVGSRLSDIAADALSLLDFDGNAEARTQNTGKGIECI